MGFKGRQIISILGVPNY